MDAYDLVLTAIWEKKSLCFLGFLIGRFLDVADIPVSIDVLVCNTFFQEL